ncbi:MAG: 2-iminoacetate synthase ThiH [Kiritimatiellae bacterium]|nr:2-iminoacetate synthase ThiH [Kiritimatiellia bacterium]
MFPSLKYTEKEVDDYLKNVSADIVCGSLAKVRHDWFDLLNLISETARPFIPEMRRIAQVARRRYYGKTVSVYAPLYIGNTCINACLYCDFRRQHTGTMRRNLTLDEIRAEANAIRRTGIDSLLVVAGEDPKVNTIAHLIEVGKLLKPMFSYLALEVAPQTEEGYRQLFMAGYEGLTCFQETYDQTLYREMHPAGPKADYAWRLNTQLRAGRAGFRVLGCAFLLGLGTWQREAASLAAHAFYLMRECWEAKVQFAFPRICSVDGGFVPPCEVCEDDMEQMMLAFRIVFPQCCMTVSTREAPKFRDFIVQTAADNMSAGSRVTPGGYTVSKQGRTCRDHKADVAQFTLSDRRTPAEVFAAIRANGQEVVFKNWDSRI